MKRVYLNFRWLLRCWPIVVLLLVRFPLAANSPGCSALKDNYEYLLLQSLESQEAILYVIKALKVATEQRLLGKAEKSGSTGTGPVRVATLNRRGEVLDHLQRLIRDAGKTEFDRLAELMDGEAASVFYHAGPQITRWNEILLRLNAVLQYTRLDDFNVLALSVKTATSVEGVLEKIEGLVVQHIMNRIQTGETPNEGIFTGIFYLHPQVPVDILWRDKLALGLGLVRSSIRQTLEQRIEISEIIRTEPQVNLLFSQLAGQRSESMLYYLALRKVHIHGREVTLGQKMGLMAFAHQNDQIGFQRVSALMVLPEFKENLGGLFYQIAVGRAYFFSHAQAQNGRIFFEVPYLVPDRKAQLGKQFSMDVLVEVGQSFILVESKLSLESMNTGGKASEAFWGQIQRMIGIAQRQELKVISREGLGEIKVKEVHVVYRSGDIPVIGLDAMYEAENRLRFIQLDPPL